MYPPHLLHKQLIYRLIKSFGFANTPSHAPVKWWLSPNFVGRMGKEDSNFQLNTDCERALQVDQVLCRIGVELWPGDMGHLRG